jgi:hypothetical protein
MGLNLERLFSIARGEIAPETGVTGVTGVTAVTGYASKTPELRRLRRLRLENTSFQKDKIEGVTEGVTIAPALPDDPDAGQVEADRRNRDAISAGWTDRYCACGVMATVAIFDPSPKRGNSRWLCIECFEADRAQVAADESGRAQ